MHSHLKATLSPRVSPSHRQSPNHTQYISIRTDPPAVLAPQQLQNTHRPTLALSPSERNRPKIRLVSPLKHGNRSNLQTKENSPSAPAGNSVNACSPFKLAHQIELGGNPQRNMNQISNISIKQHLEPVERKASPCRAVPNKYSAFVIMNSPKQAQNAQRTPTTSFRKQPISPYITINNKPFDISSLKAHIIHVSPFNHVGPARPHPQIIHEETENSSFKDSCEDELREIREMRKEMELESSRVRDALKASKLSQEVCVSHLVFANEQGRTEKKNNSKLLNLEDAPLHQSRIKTEEKLVAPPEHQEAAPKVEESIINNQITCHPMGEQQCNDIHASSQQSPQEPEIIRVEASISLPTKEGITSEKTLINELNFLTAKKLTQENREGRDEICVQTEAIPQETISSGSATGRMRLAIVRNQECLIKLPPTQAITLEPIAEEPTKEEPTARPQQQGQDEAAEEISLQNEEQSHPIQTQQAQTSQICQSQIHEQPSCPMKSQKEVKGEQLNSELKCKSNHSIASEVIYVELMQSHAESTPRSHLRAESNLSLQLEPAVNELPQPKPCEREMDSSRGIDEIEVGEQKSGSIIKVQRIALKESKKEGMGLASMRSAPSGKALGMSKRGHGSTRSIHNSIYL